MQNPGVLMRRSCIPGPGIQTHGPRERFPETLVPRSVEWAQRSRGGVAGTDLKAGHADELSRRVVEVDPLRQQVAAISEVQKTLLLLALGVLAGRGRHVPPDACTASGQKLWRAERSTRDLTPTVRNLRDREKAESIGRASRAQALFDWLTVLKDVSRPL